MVGLEEEGIPMCQKIVMVVVPFTEEEEVDAGEVQRQLLH